MSWIFRNTKVFLAVSTPPLFLTVAGGTNMRATNIKFVTIGFVYKYILGVCLNFLNVRFGAWFI